MEQLVTTVKQVVIFVLVFQVIMNLFAQSSYRRYFQFVEGILLITLILSPVFGWLHKGDKWLDKYKTNWSDMEVEWDVKELETIEQRRDELLMEQVESEEKGQ